MILQVVSFQSKQRQSAPFLHQISTRPPPHLRLVVTVVVVNRRSVIFGVFAGEPPLIQFGQLAMLRDHCPEGCVLVMRGDADIRVDHFADVLVAVMGVVKRGV